MAAAEAIRAGKKVEPFFMARLGTLYARANKVREAERTLEDMKATLGDLLAASGISRSDQVRPGVVPSAQRRDRNGPGEVRGRARLVRDGREPPEGAGRRRSCAGPFQKRERREGDRAVPGTHRRGQAGRRSPGGLDPGSLPLWGCCSRRRATRRKRRSTTGSSSKSGETPTRISRKWRTPGSGWPPSPVIRPN